MADKTQKDKRSFVRAQISAEVKARQVELGSMSATDALKNELESIRDTYEKELSQKSPNELVAFIANYLVKIDSKLNYILESIEKDLEKDDLLEVIDTSNISGSGMSMIVNAPVKVGQGLYITLNIPGFPAGIFKTYAKTVRVTPLAGKETGSYEVGVVFVNLSEEDRERLIAYTFYQQRQAIRNLKNG